MLATVIKDPSLHKFDDRTELLAHRIFEYVLDRIRMSPAPLDGPRTAQELTCQRTPEPDVPDRLFIDSNCDFVDGDASMAIFVSNVRGDDTFLGNPGMAVAGMGDVLTGVIAGITAQCGDLALAAMAGVFVHACAGDRAAATGERGLLATDVIDQVRSCVNPR